MIIIMTLNTSGKLKMVLKNYDMMLIYLKHIWWDFGNRYTLTDSDLKTIQEFVKPFKKHLK
jgi:hypothetical protein